MSSNETKNEIKARLLAQGAHLGTIDAFDAIIRKIEDEYVARARAAARDKEYSLNSIGPIALEQAAREIESLRR